MQKVDKEHSSVSCLRQHALFFLSVLCAGKYALLPQTKFVLIYFFSLQHSQRMEVFLKYTLTTTATTSHSNHTSLQRNPPLLVGPLLIEIRLKSAFWRKLQPLYCSSVLQKRETRISINNGPTNRGWSAGDKSLSCLTLVQCSQSCISTDTTIRFRV